MKYFSIPAVIVFFFTTSAGAQTTYDGEDLVMRSSGNDSGNDWVLDENGYVGTYITLASPGQVTIEVEASGAQTPHMNIVLNDTKAGFDVSSGFNTYQHTFDLPAGTHFLRTEVNNVTPGSSRELTVRELTVTGATVSNVNTNTNALNAADTYIDNYRKGDANVTLVGVSPGTPVDIKLKNHAFNFGTAVGGFNDDPGGSDEWIAPNPTPGSDAAILQQHIVELFNTIVPGNAGKWQQNEFNRDSLYYPVLDDMFDFADDNNLRMRMHNMIWGNQQPNWVKRSNNFQPLGLLDKALMNDATAKAQLRDEISERIGYYIGDGVGGDWSDHYNEVDILNEAVHVTDYIDVFGLDGLAEIYAEALAAVAATGNDVDLYENEYNVLQDSGDYYGNWYRQHIESINNAGEGQVVTGIGIQSYENNNIGTTFDAHYPARKMQTLQNLSVLGLPITLTEFGVKGPSEGQNTSEADAAQMLDETLRLVFGTAQATGFLIWGFTELDIYREGAAFYDSNWNEREPLYAWQDLMNAWDTDLNLVTGPGGIVNFDGFYGDYEIIVDGETYDLTLTKGVSNYQLIFAVPGDADGDGDVDLDDYNIMSGNMYTATAGGADEGDFNDDGFVNFEDFVIQALNFGDWPDAEETLGNVPEPTVAGLLLAMFGLTRRQSC